MIILTAAALAAAQPAPAPQAQAGPPANHAGHMAQGADHAAHGRMQHGQNCPCCDHSGANGGRDCCDEMQQRGRQNRQ